MGYDVYLAGPMRGYDEFNFPAFYAAEDWLREEGFTVRNPARHDVEDLGFDATKSLEENGFDLAVSFAWDAQQVCEADGIVLLPGWRDSSGASLEYQIAMLLGKIVWEYDDYDVPYDGWRLKFEKGYHRARWEEPACGPESVLEEAQRLIHGDRNEAYGHPLDDFSATAAYWKTWVHHKYGIDVEFEAHDVGMMMSLLKHSREGNSKKRDNKVDIAGYVGTVEMCEDEENRRGFVAAVRRRAA